jgi:P27 family predicted phage terminase small subunit
MCGMATQSTGAGRGAKAQPLERRRGRGRIHRRLPALPVPETALANVDLTSIPEPPPSLGPVGVQAWKVFWAAGRRHLSELHDSALMGRLCLRMEQVAELEAWLSEDITRRWYQTANGQIVTHPAVKQIEHADAQMTAWLSLLGFTPSDRARLGLAEIRVANELDQFRRRKSSVVDVEEVPAV